MPENPHDKNIESNNRQIRAFFSSPLFDICQFSLLIAILAWLAVRSADNIGYNWQWYRIPRYLFSVTESGIVAGPLVEGLLITIQISLISLFFALAVGLLTAIFRLSNSFVARGLAIIYLETSRNTPLLIQIFFIYFVVGPMLGLERMVAAILALSLFEGAYASEIFRSGIQSVDQGQIEAAHSLGLTTFATYRHIIIPQAIRTVLPPLTSQAISLVKDSALVSTIAIYDLTMQGQALIAESYLTFEIWFTVAAMYLSITLFLSVVVGMLEKRLSLP
ncbi:amino acid ABC transporter permease [Desulfopila sp. IMCC35006]|uniref:amino acid ABC transporter permease n=1 Tax=Desulfopila sp. IMCC35006 TaxID=2569542 RepID=UPI0010ACB0BB|nr:amino acid ABC transporter permease [Desulfopila sp. IMCC35006]TKB24434.1 amino acid ABC transporter permease [Desulfopila sp. IMCC35006]